MMRPLVERVPAGIPAKKAAEGRKSIHQEDKLKVLPVGRMENRDRTLSSVPNKN